jgi:hypothetical protein
MANYRAISNGNWSNLSIWQDNGSGSFVASTVLPSGADDVYSNTFTVNIDQNITVLSLRNTSATSITAGGSFNFNTAGVTAIIAGATPFLMGATNTITVTHSSGLVSINCTNDISHNLSTGTTNLISYTGSGNLTITTPNLRSATTNAQNMITINKSSSGTLTINGNIIGNSAGTTNSGSHTISSSSGSVIVNGNVVAPSVVQSGGSTYTIIISGGSLTINGLVNGGGASSSGNATAIQFSGSTLTINNTITGGSIQRAVTITSAISVELNCNLVAGVAETVYSTVTIPVFIVGNVTASSTASAISLTNGSAQVFLKGSMINNAGKMAIYAPRIWVDKDTAMYSQFFTSGGANRTLYSADTFPNTPIPANVRSGITFGPDNSLTGTLIIPPTNTVAQGVQVDNTTGTALLTVQEILDEIKNSSDPMAVRLINSITPEIMGKLLQWAKI